MAKLTWQGREGFSLNKLNLYNIKNAWDYETSSTRFIARYEGGTNEEFRGSGFTYGSDGYPTGGTVTSYKLTDEVKALGSITGIKISAASLAAAARTSSQSDDRAIYKKALSGNDIIKGGKHADKLEGFAGNDKLYGGYGDKYYGGLGADTFYFADPGPSVGTIYDFSHKQKDKINLQKIDADFFKAGNQAFTFIGTAAFTGTAGEIRYQKVSGGIKIQADTFGDGFAEFGFTVKGISSVSASDFYL